MSTDIWQRAAEYVQKSEILLGSHSAACRGLFLIHARTLQAEIAKRVPEARGEALAFLDITATKINRGELVGAFHDLSIGVIKVLPEKEKGVMDERLVGLFAKADKGAALGKSFEYRAGFAPTTVNYLLKHSRHKPEVIYAAKLGDIFPDPNGIQPAMV